MTTLPKISPELIAAYQAEMQRTSSTATAKRKSVALNRFFDWAHKEGHIEENPIAKPIEKNLTASVKQTRFNVKTWATLSVTGVLVVIIFLLLGKVKLPIPFIRTPAQESNIQTVTNNQTDTGPDSINANSAVNGAWNLYAKLKLTNSSGEPQVGSQSLSFKLYNSQDSSTPLYSSPVQNVTTDSQGSTLISLEGVPADLFFQNERLFLEPSLGPNNTSSKRIPVSTANVPSNLNGYFAADLNGATEETVPVINSDGSLVIASETPAIKSTTGNFLIEGQAVTLKTTDGSDGNFEINPDGQGIAHFLFEGTGKNFLNAQAPNLTSGSLYYGIVANNATGYDLLRLQNGTKPVTRLSVDALGNTYVGGNLNVARDIKTNGTTRVTSGGALTNITGYSQNSGSFVVNQNPGDFASITKNGTALSDVLTLTLDERPKPQYANTGYSTLVLKRFDGATEAYALFVDEGNARFDGQLQLGRFSSNPTTAIGQGSLVFNTGDNSVYVWTGSAWQAIGGGGTTSFSTITSGTNTSATMVVGSGASLSYSGTGTINATTLNSIADTSFLRSDTSDNFTSGTLTTDAGTTLDVNGDIAISDTNIAFDGASTTFTTTGDLTLNIGGGDLILANNQTFNVGGSGSDTAFNVIGDSVAGASGSVDSDDDLYIEGTLEVDGSIIGNGSGLTAVNADTLDSLDSTQFLRSDTSDNFTSGTLTTDAGTTLDINGDLVVSDTGVVFDGATTAFTTTGDLTLNIGGGDLIFTDTQTFNVGGSGSDVAFNVIGDSVAGASSNVDSDNDLYIEGNLEVDGTLYGNGSGLTLVNADTLDTLDSTQFLRSDTSDNFTSGTLTTDAGTTFDVNGDIAIADTNIVFDGATTTFTTTGDLTIDSGGGQVILSDTDTLNVGGKTGLTYNAFANAADSPEEASISSDNDLYIGGDLEVDGTIYGTISGSAGSVAWDDITAPIDDLTLSMVAFNTTFNWDPGADTTETNFTLTTQGEDTVGGGDEDQVLLSLSQTSNGVDVDEAADALLTLANDDANDPINSAIRFDAGAAGVDFTYGINFDAANIGTAEIVLENAEQIQNQTDGSIVLEDGSGSDYAAFTAALTTIAGDLAITGGNITTAVTADSTLTVTGTLTANGTLDANGQVDLGDGGDTVSIDSTDWDITTTGDVSGLGSIAADGDLTITQATPSIFLVDSTAASDDFSINIDGSSFTVVNDTDTRTDLAIDGTGNATFGANVTTTGDLAVNGNDITSSGALAITPTTTLTLNSTGNMTLDSSADIILDADGADLIFNDGGTTVATFTNSSTDLTLDIVGGNLYLADGDTINIGGLTAVAYNSLANSGEAPEEVAISTDNDLYIGGDLEVDGVIYGTVSGSAGSVAWDDITSPSGNLTLTMADWNTTFNWDPGADTTETNYILTTQGEDTIGGGDEDQVLLALSQTANGTDVDEAADALLTFANADANDPVNSAVRFDAGGAGTDFAYGINFDAASFATAEIILQNGETIDNTADGTIALGGGLTVSGNTTLGDAITDSLTFTSRVAQDSDLIPITTTGTNDLGSALLPWDNIYGVALFQNGNAVCDSSGANCPGASTAYWGQALGALYPVNNSVDVLIGSDATTSAKFAFINVATGTPTASIAGSVTDVATFLTGNGNLATTNMNDLTLGGSTTGNVTVNSRGSTALTANGANLTASGTLTLPNSNTLTGVASYLQVSNGLSVGGATTFYFDSAGTINANAGTFGGTLTANGSFNANGAFALGDGGDTGLVNTSDWDITATGNMSNIGSIGMDGDLTNTQATPSLLLVDSGGDDYSINVDANAFTIVNDSDSRTELSFAGDGSIDFGDNTATKTIDIGGVTASGTDTINIATNGTAADAITIGNSNASTTLALTGGDDWSITATGDLTLAGNAAVNGGSITTTATTATLFNTNATTLSFAGAATTLNIAPTGSGASTVVISGGSADTGCTLDGSNGNLTCSGTMTSLASSGTNGWWQLNNKVLSPSNTTYDLAVGGTATASAKFQAFGVETEGGNIAKLTSSVITTGDVLSATASAITTGNILKLGEGGDQTFSGNVILADIDNTGNGDGGFTGNFLRFDSATVTKLTIDASGNIIMAGGAISDTTDEVDINDSLAVSSVLQVGGTSALTYSRFGTATTGHGLSTADDVLIGSDLELNGILYLDGRTISNPDGTASIILPVDPITTAATLTASNWLVENTANVGQAALIVNQTKAGDLFTASSSGTPRFAIENDGDTAIGTNIAPQKLTVRQDDVENIVGIYDGANNTNLLLADAGVLTLRPTAFDTVYSCTDATCTSADTGTFATNTTEAKTNLGTAFSMIGTGTTATFYVGLDHQYTTMNIDINVAAVGVTLETEYWDGAAWTALSGVTDNTSDLTTDGTITYDLPTDWETTTINSTADKYWIRMRSSTNVTTAPTAYFTSPTTGHRFYNYAQSGDASPAMYINDYGNVGINTAGPDNRFEILDANNPQLRLTHTDGSVYTTMQTDSNGYLLLDPTGSRTALDGSLQVGSASGPLAYSRFGTATTGHGLTTADDLLVSGELELNSTLFLDNGTIANSAGTATVIFSSTPTTDANTLSASNWLIENTANVGQAALIVNQTKAGPLITASASGTTRFTVANNGDVTLGDNSGTDLTVGGGTGKIDAGTVDPPYTINGKKYATFLTGIVGVKEEVVGLAETSQYVAGVGYRYVIDFNSLPEGSDLWLFGKATDIKTNIDKLVALLTPSEPTRVWYEVDTDNKRLVIYSARPTTISYRLTGPRFDHENWSNRRDEDNPIVGFILNDLDISNNNPISVTIQNMSDFVFESIQDGYFVVRDSSGNIVDGLESIGNLVAANIKAGFVQAKNVATDTLAVATELVTPNLKTNLISPVAQGDLTLKIAENSNLSIKNNDNQEVASIDEAGNATFSGEISSDSVATNEIVAGKIYADEIIARNGNFAQTNTASISGVTREEIEEILANVTSNQNILSEASSWDILTASGSANLNEIAVNDLYVTGQAAVNALSVTTSLTLGTDLVLENNSINTLASPLSIQSLALAPVEIMAGLVRVDTLGNVEIAGNLSVAGNTTSGSFELSGITEGGDPLASIDASGSGTFSSVRTQDLVIAAPDATSAGAIAGNFETNSTVGKGIIPQGVSEITITNPKVNDYSLIYVTPTSATENKVLYVKSKGNGFFTVGFTDPVAMNVNFNWWIVTGQ